MNVASTITVGVFALTVAAFAPVAHAKYPSQATSGEAGYKVGCSLAASLKIPSCGELPSGRQFLKPSPTPAPAPQAPKSDGTSKKPKGAS
jgi:hypothetical protein